MSESHYFIAIPLSSNLQNLFSSWQEEIKGKVFYKQWPEKQDLHITLKFLGAVADNKVLALRKELKKIEELSEFSIEAGSIGTFGNPSKPRVIWAGVDKTESLTNLYAKIETITASIGFPKENREYRPHITLAKKWAGDAAIANLEEIKDQFTAVELLHVNHIVLYRIHPAKSPKYEVVQKYKLKRDEGNGPAD
ncbi:RNA 2',3'-cyclic phosphodiesterase [Virgibacillus profundi]|uniref:RNA 2',3'-cyclic phosphodiesterase n=1 Tax=Virgibacillus profundi TaxID=2024555 RepID=A0A2A2IFL8_9BACI|nr:RNA 2',3'-cyclic phosphodiesterase [Virgibacillus profundi]PAV30106.1 RNA 2',3'-cyclic phosphodiesterase [Virgibacillus profundi]PXY54278.1 RNA 2',3'-cyclic phosphodiesterase [Virgibacillus profundi]